MTKETSNKKVKEKVTQKEEKKVTSKKETKKPEKKKKGLFGSIKAYFKGVKKELKRIRWTSGKELLKYSIATIIFIVFFGVYFYVIDLIVALLRSLV